MLKLLQAELLLELGWAKVDVKLDGYGHNQVVIIEWPLRVGVTIHTIVLLIIHHRIVLRSL
jgi:hypothetical protein